MNKTLQCLLSILLLACITFLGCPDNKTAESQKKSTEEATAEKDTTGKDTSDKGAIEKWTDKTAQEAVDKLQKPIDKARALKEQADDRLKEMTDKLPEQ